MLVLKKFYYSNITKKYISWLKNKDIIKFTRIDPNTNISKIKKYIKHHQNNSKEKLYRIIYQRKHVGNIRIYFPQKKTATIAILIGSIENHSKGIGTKSIYLALKILRKLKIKEVLAYVHEKNIASIKIFKKNNFKIIENNNGIIFRFLFNKKK